MMQSQSEGPSPQTRRVPLQLRGFIMLCSYKNKTHRWDLKKKKSKAQAPNVAQSPRTWSQGSALQGLRSPPSYSQWPPAGLKHLLSSQPQRRSSGPSTWVGKKPGGRESPGRPLLLSLAELGECSKFQPEPVCPVRKLSWCGAVTQQQPRPAFPPRSPCPHIPEPGGLGWRRLPHPRRTGPSASTTHGQPASPRVFSVLAPQKGWEVRDRGTSAQPEISRFAFAQEVIQTKPPISQA